MGGADLSEGDVVGERYEIQEPLGEGERKRTYLARDNKLHRDVALSMIRPEAQIADPSGTEREAWVLGEIGSHDNIVSLYDFGRSDDGSVEYIVFEYLAGGTLADRLKNKGVPSLEELLRLARQVTRGLAHLHARGLLHRDVSPENVWLDARGTAHLGDFDSVVPVSVATEGLPLTTFAFASPEEKAGAPLDVRSDLYSLGALLYATATGQTRPAGLTFEDIGHFGFPSSFWDLVKSLVAESPENRPPDTEAVLTALGDIRRTADVGSLISDHESGKVEFKASLHHAYGPLDSRVDLRLQEGLIDEAGAEQENRQSIQHAVVKTCAAFLNTDGGSLLIGIGDDRSVLGIEADFRYLAADCQNVDGWQRSLKGILVKTFGAEVWKAVAVSVVPYEGHLIAVVDCKRGSRPILVKKDGKDQFYVRQANTSEALVGSDLLNYVADHWK